MENGEVDTKCEGVSYVNKRQAKKLDNKLRTAIRELNNDVAIHEGFPLITDERVEETLIRVKQKQSVNKTLKDYKKLIKK